MKKKTLIKKKIIATKTIFNDKGLALLTEIDIHITNAKYYSDLSNKSIALAKRFLKQCQKNQTYFKNWRIVKH